MRLHRNRTTRRPSRASLWVIHRLGMGPICKIGTYHHNRVFQSAESWYTLVYVRQA